MNRNVNVTEHCELLEGFLSEERILLTGIYTGTNKTGQANIDLACHIFKPNTIKDFLLEPYDPTETFTTLCPQK